MDIPIWQVDAFTDRAFAGNPAGVCILEKPADPAWMQAVAREMNLSETAFLLARDRDYNLRWFTPMVEVDLCGHATLASAHILWSEGILTGSAPARFDTRSGPLAATLKEGGWIELDFPQTPAKEASPPPGLLEALGVAQPHYVGSNNVDYLIEVDSEDKVRGLRPDFARLKTVTERGVMVTSRASDPALDFVSRFFAPAVGVDEDPVTGSAHCTLGPYWRNRLEKIDFEAQQISERGGRLKVRVGRERVYISGRAVTVFKGRLLE